MIPTNSSNRGTTPLAASSKGILWQGPDLQCIEVCKGDNVSDIIAKLAEEVCELLETLNLTDLDLKCLIENCLACPQPEKTLKTALRLIIEKVCELEELIENGSGEPVPIPVFLVNLKCLAVVDGSGNILNDDTNDKIIQSIIDRVCQHDSDIALIQVDVDNLDARVTVLEQVDPTPPVPNVPSACLFPGVKPLNDAYTDLDSAFCTISALIGSNVDINKAIGEQCKDLNNRFVLNPNFSLTPRNFAQSMRNLWITMCDTMDRVRKIETTCCQLTCEAVKVGFNIVFSDHSTVTVKFTTGAGTNIPPGVVDCGSVLVVSDELGRRVVVENLNINNNVEVPDIDTSEFTEGGLLTFTLTYKMCSEELGTCEKVVVKTAIYKTPCSTCEVSNSGDGEVIIVYETSGATLTTETVVISDTTSSSTSTTTTTTGL